MGTFVVLSGAPFHATGGGQQPAQISRALVRLGYRVAHYQPRPGEAGLPTHGVVTVSPPAGQLRNELWLPRPTGATAYWNGFVRGLRQVSGERWLVVCCPLPWFAAALAPFRQAGWKLVYWLLDDWSEFLATGYLDWYREDVERLLVAKADVVLATAVSLADKASNWGRDDVTIVPNGYDDQVFRRADWVPGSRKRVVYWGCLNGSWLDWETLDAVARQRPDWDLDLIGGHPAQRLDLPNIRYLGAQPVERLPEFRGDVGLVPFRQGALSRAVDPIKAYEYQALGMATVACRMPQLDGWDGVTQVAGSSPRDWIAAIEHAAPPTRLVAGRSWADRAQQFLDALA